MLSLVLAAILVPQASEDPLRALREKVEGIEKARPAADAPAFDAWNGRCMDVHFEYGIALFRLAEERRQQALYTEVVKHFTAFIWRWDDYLAALQARITLARAHQALQQWGPCFANLAGARLADLRKNPAVVEIATHAWTQELRSRAAFGKGLDASLARAGEHLKNFPQARETEPFLAMRLEMARAGHALGRDAECERALREILDRHAEAAAGESALQMLVEFHRRPPDVLRFADRLFEAHHFTAAAVHYRELERTPRVWLRLGMCYSHLRRFHEAVEALQQAGAKDAAVLLERVLRRLAAIEPSMKSRLDVHREWMRKHMDLAEAGPATVMMLADGLLAEGRHREAAELYAQIKSGEEGHEEAVHTIGYCRYKLKEYGLAVAALETYLAFEKRTPRSTDSAIDLICGSLLAQGKPEELLAFTEKAVPRDAVTAQWRLAHRVDALARLGRFKEARETYAAMNESTALKPAVRALERLAAGYEEALRRTGDKKLWGPYARLVVTLSEKTYQPLRGERLLAAADALALESTAESHALAYDLYTQYLADAGVRGEPRPAIEYRRAVSAVGAGRLDHAMEIAEMLVREHPGNGSYGELRADIASAQAERMKPGAERTRLLDEAVRTYAELTSALLRKPDEHFHRLAEKYARHLFARDPGRARDFFLIMERKGYGRWDEDQWGFRSKMDALRRKVFDAVPPRK